jgi:hypothetical protein
MPPASRPVLASLPAHFPVPIMCEVEGLLSDAPLRIRSTDWNLGGHMPKREARNPTSAKGDWFIDDRCIDCAASREVAPGLIVERGGKSVFARQPVA